MNNCFSPTQAKEFRESTWFGMSVSLNITTLVFMSSVWHLSFHLNFNLTTDGGINSQNKRMLRDYRLNAFCGPG